MEDLALSSSSIDIGQQQDDSGKIDPLQLCASCDRCRARKTKCDGNRPCSNCAVKYMKKNKLTSIDGCDFEAFDCFYSPAKRRGPNPGRLNPLLGGTAMTGTGTTTGKSGGGGRIAKNNDSSAAQGGKHSLATPSTTTPTSQPPLRNHDGSEWQPNTMLGVGGAGATTAALMGTAGSVVGGSSINSYAVDHQQQQTNIQHQLNLLQQQIQQQQQQQQQLQATKQIQHQHQQPQFQNIMNPSEMAASAVSAAPPPVEPNAQRRKVTEKPLQQQSGIPRSIMAHTHLLDRGDPDGSRLRAYYKLSIDEMFRLPCTPTDEEYCARTGQQMPGSHLAALSAARFAEAALGAIVHNEVGLAMELCNAVVHCLRESVQEPVDDSVMFEVAKAYFLLGVFRAYRGDMTRYFKYRRVCLTYLSKLEGDNGTHALLAAMSYLDSWAYMIYNACEKDLPDVDSTIPPVLQQGNNNMGHGSSSFCSPIEVKYGVKMDLFSIASDPKNKNWIQGAPAVYLNNEAPLPARSLDALSCAVRTCCDQANSRFAAIAKENDPIPDDNMTFHAEAALTPTFTAVLSHENELCSRNMVLSAYTLMQQHEATKEGNGKSEGQHLVISAMDAFLENGDSDIDGGFTDSQIQSLLSVCNSAVENPLLLHHAGPTYHMVSNAAILLCHLLNGMHSMKANNQFGPMEATMFEEVLETFIAVRKLLTIHRRKLPVRLRCHGIPRPSLDGVQEGQPFIDLGETLLCACRGCQGFVLMACSPCVAAERARSAASRMDVAAAQETEAVELGEISNGGGNFGSEFDLDDDALLALISNLITN